MGFLDSKSPTGVDCPPWYLDGHAGGSAEAEAGAVHQLGFPAAGHFWGCLSSKSVTSLSECCFKKIFQRRYALLCTKMIIIILAK